VGSRTGRDEVAKRKTGYVICGPRKLGKINYKDEERRRYLAY
jgi:hypothetical protein